MDDRGILKNAFFKQYYKQKKKVISFSLWGNNPIYTVGAIRNAELAQLIYPEWVCRYYIGHCVSDKILNKLEVNYAVLGKEEGCTGDPARRAGNEYLFQMQALNNISTLNQYNIKKIVTTCPHCFNTLKNE